MTDPVLPERARGMSRTTALLCAAVHTDRELRSLVLQAHENSRHLPRYDSDGVDEALLLAEAKRANRRVTLRNVGLMLIGLVLFFVTTSSVSDPTLAELIQVWWLIGGLVTAVILFWEHLHVRYGIVADRFVKGREDQGPPVPRDEQGNDAPVLVYGGYSPFVGSGVFVGGWTVVVDISRGKVSGRGEPNKVRDFEISELYDCVNQALRRINIPNLAIADRVCVAGHTLHECPDVLPEPMGELIQTIDQATLRRLMQQPDQYRRYYKRIAVADPAGDVSLSLFLRVSRTGRKLFVEAHYYVLPPMKESFYLVENFRSSPTMSDPGHQVVKSVLSAPVMLVTAPLIIFQELQRRFDDSLWGSQVERSIRENRCHNYGSVQTIREKCARSSFRSFFQERDVDRARKCLEKEVLDILIDFLDDHDIDTSELRERQNTILNDSVIVSGTISGGNIAIGQTASAGTMEKRARGRANASK